MCGATYGIVKLPKRTRRLKNGSKANKQWMVPYLTYLLGYASLGPDRLCQLQKMAACYFLLVI